MAEKQSKKPKVKQLSTIQDEDLKTALHDEILLWLDAHVTDLLGTMKGHRHEIAVHYHGLEVGQTATTRVRFEVVKKDWQKPIIADKSIIGFVDLLVEFRAFPQEWEAFVFDDRYRRPED